MIKNLSFLFVSVALLSQSSFAMNRSHKWGLGVDLGATVPVAPSLIRDIADPSVAAGAHLRYHVDSLWGMALSYDRLEFGDTTLATNAINLGVFARLLRDKDFTPWLLVGVGPENVSSYAGAANYWRFGVKAEAGVEYDFCSSVSLGAKLAYFFVTKNENTLHALAPSVVATWYFGASEPVAALPQHIKSVEAPAAIKDMFTQAIAGKSGVKLNVEFDPGKSVIKAGENNEIEKVAAFMKQQPDTKITLEGHTDSSGNAKHNTTLSQLRAEAVRTALIEKYGVDAARLRAVGYGASRPVAENKTKDGRARNRRVMAVVDGE